MQEAGVPGYEFSTWYGLLVPARAPKAVIDRLNRETRAAGESQAVREQFTRQGLEPVASTPAEFAAYLRSEVAKWAPVIKASGATADQSRKSRGSALPPEPLLRGLVNPMRAMSRCRPTVVQPSTARTDVGFLSQR